jgi:uncharacterized protein YjiS (DUF1127 family)
MSIDTVNRDLPLIVTEVVNRTPAPAQAHPNEMPATPLLATLRNALARWWRSYRSEATVMNARDDMLKDMGLSRAEIEHWISGRPYL